VLALACTSAASSRQVARSSVSSCDALPGVVEQPQPQRGHGIVRVVVAAGEGAQARAHGLAGGELLAQLERELGEQVLGLVEQVSAAGQDRAARAVPERQQLGRLVRAAAGGALERS
jgi:hypothetical protein